MDPERIAPGSHGKNQRLAFRTEEGLKPTDWEAAIFIDSPVFGLRPWRAARFFTSKVPKPMIWTFLSVLIPLEIESRTASRASSAARFVVSFPRVFWMDSTSAALFMAPVLMRTGGRIGKRKPARAGGKFPPDSPDLRGFPGCGFLFPGARRGFPDSVRSSAC